MKQFVPKTSACMVYIYIYIYIYVEMNDYDV